MKKNIFLLLLTLLVFSACQHSPVTSPKISTERYAFADLPSLEKNIPLGGFSGLSYEGKTPTGELLFRTHTDRGPNLASKKIKSVEVRPFLLPDFQPEWVVFRLAPNKGLSLRERVPLMTQDGKKISGLPNKLTQDEVPVDAKNHRLPLDPMGLDLEGLVRDPDGSFWMSEEYRPSVLHFSQKGVLLSRWIPEGNADLYGTPILPAHYQRRVMNRGFEGIALQDPFLFLFLQSPLQGEKDITRILKIDKRTGKPLAEYAYVFEPTPTDWPLIDKIGDAAYVKDNQFLVIEQNGGTTQGAFRKIYKINLQNATNLLTQNAELSPSSLCSKASTANCIKPAQKTEVADLVALGFGDLEKMEGLALLDANTLAVVNDNDFQVNNSTTPSFLGIIHLPQPLW